MSRIELSLLFAGNFRDLVLHDLDVGAGAMVGAERPAPLDGRAAHQGFGAGLRIGDDPATLFGADRPIPHRQLSRLIGQDFEEGGGRHQESLARD
ncbi:hypothetical protein [Dongia sedimenti]|uniref:Uncharacterized protein n=1 Tax=Dongia sedimenti TaxID=3064282 RepID=A0ABU0YES1_9PROT|nr:hypothetical protein [Rhodospirillaceae bacterium R-7]